MGPFRRRLAALGAWTLAGAGMGRRGALRRLAALGALLCCQPALAADEAAPKEAEEERWHRVDLLVFKYQRPDLAGEGVSERPSFLPAGLTAIAQLAGPSPVRLSQLEQLARDAAYQPEENAFLLADDLAPDSFLFAGQAGATLNRWLMDSLARRRQGQPLPYYRRLASHSVAAGSDDARLDALLKVETPAFTQLPSGSRLQELAAQIDETAGLQLLQHQSWLQRVGLTPVPVLLQAGARHGDRYEVEGSLSVSVPLQEASARQLWLMADLWITLFENRKLSRRARRERVASPLDAETLAAHAPLLAAEAGRLRMQQAGRYLLRQARSIRTGEIHYLDHPLIGLLVALRRHELPSEEEPAP